MNRGRSFENPGQVRARVWADAGVAVLAYAAWTTLATSGMTEWANVDPPESIAQATRAAGLTGVLAVATHHFTAYGLALLVAFAALRMRQRRLALAFALPALSLPLWEWHHSLYARAEYLPQAARLLGMEATAYPSADAIAVTVLSCAFIATARATHAATVGRRLAAMAVGALAVAASAYQWLLGNASVTELLGGALFGAAIATAAVAIAQVDPVRHRVRLPRATAAVEQVAVVVNPVKVELDLVRAKIDDAAARLGWPAPEWWETTVDEHGGGLARRAVDRGATRVVAIGGDGTVRSVCAGLAGTRASLGIVPAGTGNLLARNLGLPLDEDAAIVAALVGDEAALDLLEWESAGDVRPFVVMGGAGLDARIMATTRSRLKRWIGSLAYVHAAVRQLKRAPVRTRIEIDGRPVYDGTTTIVLVGNVGSLQHGFTLLPEAVRDSGRLAAMVANPSGLREWAHALSTIAAGTTSANVQRFSGRELHMEFDEPVPFELDGDHVASTSTARILVRPQAVRVALRSVGTAPAHASPSVAKTRNRLTRGYALLRESPVHG